MINILCKRQHAKTISQVFSQYWVMSVNLTISHIKPSDTCSQYGVMSVNLTISHIMSILLDFTLSLITDNTSDSGVGHLIRR